MQKLKQTICLKDNKIEMTISIQKYEGMETRGKESTSKYLWHPLGNEERSV